MEGERSRIEKSKKSGCGREVKRKRGERRTRLIKQRQRQTTEDMKKRAEDRVARENILGGEWKRRDNQKRGIKKMEENRKGGRKAELHQAHYVKRKMKT